VKLTLMNDLLGQSTPIANLNFTKLLISVKGWSSPPVQPLSRFLESPSNDLLVSLVDFVTDYAVRQRQRTRRLLQQPTGGVGADGGVLELRGQRMSKHRHFFF
jgi:hypothetical protein